MTNQETLKIIKSIASDWKKYAETLDNDALKQEAEILEKIANDYGEIALRKFHKDPGEGNDEQLLEGERKGSPITTTERQLSIRRNKFTK